MKKKTTKLTYRPSNRGASKVLGDLEGRVMESLWDLGSGTVTEVHAGLGEGGKDLAYNTVNTILTRLYEKGYLERNREGKAFRYAPVLERSEFVAEFSQEVFSGLAEDLSGPVVSAFVDRLSPKEAEALEKLAEHLVARRARKRKP